MYHPMKSNAPREIYLEASSIAFTTQKVRTERQNLKTYGDKHHMMLLDYSTSEKKIWIGI
jgi:hypothetical protein